MNYLNRTDEIWAVEKPSPILVYSKHKTRFLILGATVTYWLPRHLCPCVWKRGFLLRQGWKILPFWPPCRLNSWQHSQEGVSWPTPWLTPFSPMDGPNYKSPRSLSEVPKNAVYEEEAVSVELMRHPPADKGGNALCATKCNLLRPRPARSESKRRPGLSSTVEQDHDLKDQSCLT